MSRMVDLSDSAPRSRHSAPTADRRSAFLAWGLIALLAVAVLAGGGGSRYAMANLAVQVTALVVLAFHREAFFRFWREAPIFLRLLIAISILVPIAHLVPLPFTTSTSLPGRGLVRESFELIGTESWLPLSVDPGRTLGALAALIVPLAIVALGWSLKSRQLIMLGWAVVVLALINVLVGIPQVLSNGQFGLLYPENPMPGVLFGTFANRNSTGLFLVAGLTLAALLPAPFEHKVQVFVRIAICLLLVIAVVLTRSRTAMVLALVPVVLAGIRVMFPGTHTVSRPASARRAAGVALLGGVLMVAVIASLIALSPGRIGESLSRFESAGDTRAYIWEDAVYSARKYWPAGAGMGTFDEVFQADESLENMAVLKAGRAHNDYIEIAIEAGMPGLIMVASWLLALASFAFLARGSSQRWAAWSGAAILLAIALQSVTDYPLRNQAMLAVAAFALIILVRMGRDDIEAAA